MRNNIIVAAFDNKAYVQTASLWQWDQGQILRITGLDLPPSFVAEFSNTYDRGTAVTQVGSDGQVSIPDTLLQSGCPIFCWIVLSSGEGDRETVVSINMPVLRRAQPTGETPTPAQQSAIDQAIAALNAALEGITGMTAVAETLPPGSAASASWDAETNILTIGIPEGEPGADGTDGADGFSPTVSIVDIPGGHRVTITDIDGDHVFDVMDGTGGGGGTPYDSDPEALGVADPGDSDEYARGNHVHPMPSAGDVGAATPADVYASYPTDTVSGAVATFPDGAGNVPVKSLVVNIDPAQDLHGYDSPWPAGGGTNLIPMTLQGIKDANTSGTWAGNVYTRNGVDFTINTNDVGDVTTIAVNGTATSDSYLLLFSGTINLPAGDYASLISDSAVNVSMQLRIGSSSGSDVMGGATTTNRTTTVSESTNIIGRLRVVDGNTVDSATVYPMLSQQSDALSADDYEPYSNVCPISGWTGVTVSHSGADTSSPETISISRQDEAGTVYGGTLDVLSGVLTVDKIALSFSGGAVSDGTYGYQNAPLYHVEIPNYDTVRIKRASASASLASLLSNYFLMTTGSSAQYMKNNEIRTEGASVPQYLYFRWDAAADVTAINTAFSSTPLVVVAELATSATYQLTPHEVNTLLGDNNIWADTGDTAVEYRQDPTLALAEKYEKPSGGISKSDLASGVQSSLEKADTALPSAGGTMSGAIAMGSNKITGLDAGVADGDAVNVAQMASAISQSAAFYRGNFATRAALLAVAWQTSDPDAANYVTNNDYAIVLDDETQDDECWRYLYVSGTGWTAQYRINETPLTQAQLDALNSGATSTNIGQIAGKLDANQGVAHAGEFMIVGSNGVVAPVAMSTWQGGSY